MRAVVKARKFAMRVAALTDGQNVDFASKELKDSAPPSTATTGAAPSLQQQKKKQQGKTMEFVVKNKQKKNEN
jgi:hypothetical protein